MSNVVGFKLNSGLDVLGSPPKDFKQLNNFQVQKAVAIHISNVNGVLSANILPLTLLDNEGSTSHTITLYETCYLFSYTPKLEVVEMYLRHVTGIIVANPISMV